MNNLSKYSLIIGLTFLVLSCGTTKEPSEGVIAEEEMIAVLTEIELTQALIKLKRSAKDTINEQLLYDEVYKEFNTSEEAFNKSIAYYSEAPKQLMKMYGKVIENLTRKQSEQHRK